MDRKTILIIDDNETSLTLMRDIVNRIGFSAIEAGDAETGVRLAREKSPDLILMDIRLPGMDGIDATKLLKAAPETARIPVLAVSASAFERDRRRALAAGCAAYITKPFNFDEFVKTIVGYLGEREA